MSATDRFGQTYGPGDKVVVPVKSRKEGTTAELFETTVIEVIPLIPHRLNPKADMRADQAPQQGPTQFQHVADRKYVVKVEGRVKPWRSEKPRAMTVNWPQDIVKVPG